MVTSKPRAEVRSAHCRQHNRVSSLSRRTAARSLKKSIGAAIIEFTFVASVFLSVIFTIIDLGILGYVQLTMQHAVREGARYAVTGRSDLDPDDNGDRSAAIIQKISNASNGLLSKVIEEEDIRVEDIYGNPVAGFGGPGEIIAIHMDCEWPIASVFALPLADSGIYKFTVSAAMKNEEF
ncbi:TadE/TadG family type IV pilus assembly protein [Vibrio paucivorans]